MSTSETKTPLVEVLDITENDDGSANMELNVSNEFKEFYLKETNRTVFVESEFNEFIISILEKQLDRLEKEEEEK